LWQELVQEGYDSTVLHEHKRLLKGYVAEMGQHGVFDQVEDGQQSISETQESDESYESNKKELEPNKVSDDEDEQRKAEHLNEVDETIIPPRIEDLQNTRSRIDTSKKNQIQMTPISISYLNSTSIHLS